DSTKDIVREMMRGENRLKLLAFERRQGKGGALALAFPYAKGDVLIYDADGATPVGETSKVIEAARYSDVVIGSRYCLGSRVFGLSKKRRFAARFFNLLVRFLFGLSVCDTQCGFKLVKKKAVGILAPLLTARGFVWDVELLWQAKRHGLKIKEVGVEWHHCKGGPLESGGVVKTAFKMMRGLLVLRFSHRKPVRESGERGEYYDNIQKAERNPEKQVRNSKQRSRGNNRVKKR
ncbi:MAG: glycosyltransferase, partial [Candidatus Micrarchaeota archaeon]